MLTRILTIGAAGFIALLAMSPAQNDPELASKLYLASVIVAGIGNVSAGEQAWLDSLARELRLPDELKASLQAQAAQLA